MLIHTDSQCVVLRCLSNFRKAVKAALVLLPLLGANHLLAITGPVVLTPTAYAVWAFSSFFLTAFQGFIIALLYCFLNTEVNELSGQLLIRNDWLSD